MIHLIGYLHRTCLQFRDGFADSRVPIDWRSDINFNSATAEDFLSYSYERWATWPETERRRFTNILFMLNRAPAYEWDWEHFLIEYMVLDGCYRMGVEVGMLAAERRHEHRIRRLCEKFQLLQNDSLTNQIVGFRNELFHETLWNSTQPGTSPSNDSFFAPLHLRRLNQRLILGLLGYHNEYMRSAWWSMSHCRFQPP